MMVVMFTGTDTLNVVFEAGRCGAAAYLTKPFENERLLEILNNLSKDQDKPPEIERADVSKVIPPKADDVGLSLLEKTERKMIVEMLNETGGNKFEASKRLGIGRQTLYNKIKAYGIEVL